MDGFFSDPLRLCRGSNSGALHELFGPPGDELIHPAPPLPNEPSNPDKVAEQLFACEALQTSDPTGNHEEGKPYTLQWFLTIENRRHGRHARWIPRLLEFAKHKGETLLGLGSGLGTDWLQYARNGAAVIVCSSCTSQLELVRRHFQLRGLPGQFIHATPISMPLQNSSIDVACISGLLQQVDNPQTVVDEVFRVLKPGGKVIAVTPAKYDVDFWKNLVFWYRWLWKRKRDPDQQCIRFSSRQLRHLFQQYEIHRISKRHLRRSEVPHMWRLLPLPILERLLGRVLVLKAFKPVSTAIPTSAAA